MVLGAVCEAIEEEVDREEGQAPDGRLFDAGARGGFLRGRGVVESEDRDAGSDEGDDEVFVEGIAFSEDGEVQEHHGEELAGFGEDESDVVDVGETGVAKGGCEGGGDGDEDEWEENGARGEDWGCGFFRR